MQTNAIMTENLVRVRYLIKSASLLSDITCLFQNAQLTVHLSVNNNYTFSFYLAELQLSNAFDMKKLQIVHAILFQDNYKINKTENTDYKVM